MTGREKTWLAVGLLGGLIVGGTVMMFAPFRMRQTEAPSPPPVASPINSTNAQPTTAGAGAISAVQLSPDEQRKIGLRTAKVQREPLTETIVAIGRVEEPETAIATVSTRFGGRVERLFINFTGQPVQVGDPIATIAITGQPAGKDDPVSSIYSRDLITAGEEYKFALENRERARAMPRPDAVAEADALVEASRARLSRFGLTADQINGLMTA